MWEIRNLPVTCADAFRKAKKWSEQLGRTGAGLRD
jgi:hypothetical protein